MRSQEPRRSLRSQDHLESIHPGAPKQTEAVQFAQRRNKNPQEAPEKAGKLHSLGADRRIIRGFQTLLFCDGASYGPNFTQSPKHEIERPQNQARKTSEGDCELALGGVTLPARNRDLPQGYQARERHGGARADEQCTQSEAS